MSECIGNCCVAFYLPVTKEQLDERVAGGSAEMVKIANMVVPITNGTVRRRRGKYYAGESGPVSGKDEGHYYKCKNWNSDTRLCMDYENRPKMCRDYPYDRECNSCDFCPTQDVIDQYKTRVDTEAEG